MFSFKSFGGFRANGGSITAGNAYIVGEKGPELFLPKQSSSIVPNHKISSNPIVINNYIQTPDIDSFRRSEGNIISLRAVRAGCWAKFVNTKILRCKDCITICLWTVCA
jgi:hypothetical protein